MTLHAGRVVLLGLGVIVASFWFWQRLILELIELAIESFVLKHPKQGFSQRPEEQQGNCTRDDDGHGPKKGLLHRLIFRPTWMPGHALQPRGRIHRDTVFLAE